MIRRRTLTDGTERFDVDYSDAGQLRSLTFDTVEEAAEFARLYQLRRRRWPLAPLLAAAGCATTREFARRFDIPASTVTKAARGRGVTDRLADQWAITAGLHPLEVWGWAWVTAALPPAEAAELAELVDTDGEAVA